MTTREQYEQTYRMCRTNKRIGLDFSTLTTDTQRKAAHNANKSYFALRFSHDLIDTMQIRLSNAKKRAEIRRNNALFFEDKRYR